MIILTAKIGEYTNSPPNKIKQIEGMGRIKEGLNNKLNSRSCVALVGICTGLFLVLGENYQFECADVRKSMAVCRRWI